MRRGRRTDEYIITYILDAVEIGKRFTEWPLHITIIPWFDAPDLISVSNLIKDVTNDFGPIKTEVVARDYFGPRQQPVMILEKNNQLKKLHLSLLKSIENKGWPIKGRYTGVSYKPHITQKHGVNTKGKISIDALYVVESQSQGYRQVLDKIGLRR